MPQPKSQQLPGWYVNSPANTSIYLYGEGTGSSLQGAKQNALNNMAARLVVSVGSSIKTVTNTSRSAQGSTYSKDVSKAVKVDVQKIKFTNAKIEKSVETNGNFYVLAKVNRQELFDNKKGEFDILNNSIDLKYNQLSGLAKLEKIAALQEMYPKLIDAKKKCIVLNALNNGFDHIVYMKKYDQYIDMIEQLKQTSTLSVETNLKEKYFADVFIDMLNQNQYKISSNSDIVIKLTNKVKYSNYKGWNVAKVSTTVSVVSDGKIISNKVYATVGRSSTSKESALEGASLQFKQRITQETLDKVIFSK
jgi:hypothetical protein